jgi:hypothetical protein
VVLAFFLLPAWSDTPADCPAAQSGPGLAAPVELTTRLPPRPGMPQGGVARLAVEVPTNGTVCVTQEPDLPRDVLHGDTSTDILTGRPRGNAVNPGR